jgi:hypothetical protein
VTDGEASPSRRDGLHDPSEQPGHEHLDLATDHSTPIAG